MSERYNPLTNQRRVLRKMEGNLRMAAKGNLIPDDLFFQLPLDIISSRENYIARPGSETELDGTYGHIFLGWGHDHDEYSNSSVELHNYPHLKSLASTRGVVSLSFVNTLYGTRIFEYDARVDDYIYNLQLSPYSKFQLLEEIFFACLTSRIPICYN